MTVHASPLAAFEVAAPEVQFTAFPKIARWNREMVITEKIDGTNAAVVVSQDGRVFAQSRKRLVSPSNDNFGFAQWVWDHTDELRELGTGAHFGEWWGLGIQRGYDLDHKRFSLFNTKRWGDGGTDQRPDCCHVVPTIFEVPVPHLGFPAAAILSLKRSGSIAAPGFMRPEGIVIYHTHANALFKVTVENDDKPKGEVQG